MSIEHCPTEAMLADFFTKPLQGNLFLKFCSVILGHAHIRTIDRPPLARTEERVGQEVVNDGFNGHSWGDLEENTDDTCMAGMKATCVAGMKATLPSTDDWIVVNRRLRNERKAHSFDLIPSY
jgi:hypothetical protein